MSNTPLKQAKQIQRVLKAMETQKRSMELMREWLKSLEGRVVKLENNDSSIQYGLDIEG